MQQSSATSNADVNADVSSSAFPHHLTTDVVILIQTTGIYPRRCTHSSSPPPPSSIVAVSSIHSTLEERQQQETVKMASATGILAHNPDVEDGPGESQPLLGQPGDVLQKPDESIFNNLVSGMYSFSPLS